MKNEKQIVEEIKKRSKNLNLRGTSNYATYRVNSTYIRALLWVLERPLTYQDNINLESVIEKFLKDEDGKE